MKKLIFFLVFCIFFSSLCLAKDYFIDFRNGSDENSGISIDQAWQHAPGSANRSGIPAATILLPGDRIIFKRGVKYNDSITVLNSGVELLSGTNGIIMNSRKLKVPQAILSSYDILPGDTIYVNGEGLFRITIVSGDELTLDGQVKVLDKPGETNTFRDGMLHVGETGVAFFIGRCISYISSPDWGSGNAVISGGFTIKGMNAIIIDGGKDRELEFADYIGPAINHNYVTTEARGLFFNGMLIHECSGNSAQSAIYLRNISYSNVSNSEIYNNGILSSPKIGNDGIYVDNCNYVTIQGCDIHHNMDDGIHMTIADKSYIQHCKIYDHVSPIVHADGIQFHGLDQRWHVTVRYNMVFNNESPTQWSSADFSCYYNAFYDTTPNSLGNIGIRFQSASDQTGEIYNNIFAYNSINAVLGRSETENIRIINNIFWENKSVTGGDGYGPDVSISNPSSQSYIHNNIYVRREFEPLNGTVIEWGSTRYSVDGTYSVLNAVLDDVSEPIDHALDDLGNPNLLIGSGDKYFDKSTATDIKFWRLENRSSVEFTPFDRKSPQVSAGYNLGLKYDMYGEKVNPDNVTIGSIQLNQIAPIDPPNELIVIE